MTDDLFTHEDINKPENRVNLALFSVTQQDCFREWLLASLGLGTDAVVYPPKNRSGLRPDLKVVRGCSTVAWIEVELGKDERQAAHYRGTFSEPVKRIYGRKTDEGDLSLDEIANYLAEQTALPPQAKLNVEHLRKLIQDGLDEHSSSPGRGDMSDEMWGHKLVVGLRRRLGDKLKRTTGSVPIGYLRADSTDTLNNQGFSLRVRSAVSSDGTLSVMNITAGREEVRFPSLVRLRKYLPNHRTEVDDYASALEQLGLAIGRYAERQRPSLPLDTVLDGLDELARCVLALAGPPAGSGAIVYRQREVGGWTVPTVSFSSTARDALGLQISGGIVNSVTDNKAKLRSWKRHLACEIKSKRGDSPWEPSDDYAISLALGFHPGHHGGPAQSLDVENFIKPILDAVAAGLFCDNQTDPSTIDKWDFDDSNFNTLLVRRLPDIDDPSAEGIALFVAAR